MGQLKSQKVERVKDKNETKNKCNKQKTVKNIVDIYSTVSIITLNISGQNAPIKRQTIRMDKKQDPLYVVYKKPTK